MSLVGTQLGHYRLIQFLNGGGMGEVYLAEDLSLSRQVAIKVMKTEGSLYPNSQTAQEAQRLFQREMKVIAALDHITEKATS
jgi:eukaryotic-like serine/threonine-protein kinase